MMVMTKSVNHRVCCKIIWEINNNVVIIFDFDMPLYQKKSNEIKQVYLLYQHKKRRKKAVTKVTIKTLANK